jgi:diguanylate cyclase (GGDEF)-like protein
MLAFHTLPSVAPADSEHAGRILIVDDEQPNREMLQRRLERHGYSVMAVEGGEQALRAVTRETFDLVLLDVMMPRISGLETLKRLRESHAPASLPVVMATARDQSEDIVEALSLGANDYVTKPIDFPVALARVKAQVLAGRTARRLQASQARYAVAAECENAGLWDWNLRTGAFYTCERWQSIVGVATPHGWTDWLERIHPCDRQTVRDAVNHLFTGGDSNWEGEFRIESTLGRIRWVSCRGLVSRDAAGRPEQFAGSLVDVTAARTTSSLTGLPNRLWLLEAVDAHQSGRPQDQPGLALAVVVADGWHLALGTRGREAADALVQEVARRLAGAVRALDLVAHLGDNQFAIVLDSIDTDEEARSVAERILQACARAARPDDPGVPIGLRIGVALAGDDADAHDLLRDAGVAAAEIPAGHACGVFRPEMRAALVARIDTEIGLKAAIEAGTLVLHYQPIIDLETGQVRSFEALVRWPHPTRGLLSPASFLPVAEDSGLVVPLGQLCLAEACAAASHWRSQGGPLAEVGVNVNVSPNQLHHGTLVDDVRRALDATALPASALQIEITETTVMRDVDEAHATLAALEALGVSLALDDFGTGHSTLSHLSQFPFHVVKIDRSFVAKMASEGHDLEIVRAIVALARRISLRVTAEGIETARQLQQLQALDCAFGQGYYVARPMPASHIPAFVATTARSSHGRTTRG